MTGVGPLMVDKVLYDLLKILADMHKMGFLNGYIDF